MRIDNQFPVLSSTQSKSSTSSARNTTMSVATTSNVPAVVSDVSAFERVFENASSRFQKMESLSWLAQNALSAYESTQNLSSDNPRHQLIGVDVFA